MLGRTKMRRLVCALPLVAACFAEAPDGADDGTGGGSTSTGVEDTSAGTAGSTSTEVTLSSSATGDATSDGSSDGSDTAPTTCGNGTLEDGEACDDGNGDDTDGCTVMCTEGPRLLRLEMLPHADMFPDASASPSIDRSCAAMDVAVARRFYGDDSDAMPSWPITIGGTCSALALSFEGQPHIEITDSTIVLGEFGNWNGDPTDDWSTECPPGSVPTGFDGKVYDPDGAEPPNIRAVRLRCAALSVDPEAQYGVAFMPVADSPWAPADSKHQPYDSVCGGDAILVGLRGHLDADAASFQQLGAVCARPIVEFGPQ